MKSCLIRNSHGSWFLCPAYKKDEAIQIMEENISRWNAADYPAPYPRPPNYLISVRHPSDVIFDSYSIQNSGFEPHSFEIFK